MAKWKQDNDEIIDKCFEIDWDYGKVFKIIKKEDQLEQTKIYFKERYKYIK